MNKFNFRSIAFCLIFTFISCHNNKVHDNSVELNDSCFNISTMINSKQNKGYFGTEFDCVFMNTNTLCKEKYSYIASTNKIKIANANEQFCFTKTEELTIPELSEKPVIVLKNYEIYLTGSKQNRKSVLISWINYKHARNNVILDKNDFTITSYNRSWEICDSTVLVESNLPFNDFNKLYPGYKGIFKKCDYDSIAIDWNYYKENGDVRKFFNMLNIYLK